MREFDAEFNTMEIDLDISDQEIEVDFGNFVPVGDSYKLQSKAVTSTRVPHRVTPDSGFYGISEILVNEIPYSEVRNNSGGKTATIA